MDEKKDYKVIHEKIVPKKKNRGKKLLAYLGLVILGAILFGGIERLVFEASGRLFFSKKQEKAEKQNIELDSEVEVKKRDEVSTTPAIKPEKKKEEEPRTIVKKDIKVVEKKIDASLLDYVNIMNEFGKIAMEGNKAIVEVRSAIMGTDWFENPYETVNSTAGFTIAKQSDTVYVLTKYSEIKKAKNIKLVFENGLVMNGSLKNFNTDLNLALISVNSKKLTEKQKEKIAVIGLAHFDKLNLGQPVMALGNPDGNMYSALFGVITNVKGKQYFQDYTLDAFYTDIKPSKKGTSLLVDIYGKAIGLILESEEDGSCKILSTARLVNILENMINDKPQPYLGIITKKFEGAENKTGISGGVLVDVVAKDSPAEKAGLKEGDILYQLGEDKVEDMKVFSELLERKNVEETIKLKIYRVTRNQGKELELEAIIGDSRGIK